ncbi:hypothetical protein RN607_08115 [Demequina capsici]|uniref:Uncharacterized protein n=1 Tax=Demequina capsici TaxID=3075620 RepID=A0AA96F7V0_9MICO|nr:MULTISPECIES: hypothetical protein [unclassified Demequina]WNM23285.1 hypothetical protein RN606_07880 [Demequina sp. OYTSA14]WNM26163.1 hypothetical protein RN607_08115 [Demequina sp. PMTSA13]
METTTEVTVTVTSTYRSPNDACQDIVDVALTEPLGARVLVDGATGDEVDVATVG